jgi:hypothetical protein
MPSFAQYVEGHLRLVRASQVNCLIGASRNYEVVLLENRRIVAQESSRRIRRLMRPGFYFIAGSIDG